MIEIKFFTNFEIRNINTSSSSNLHLSVVNLNIYQKQTHYSGIRIFSSLPHEIKTYFDNSWTVKKAVKIFLYTIFFTCK